MQAAAKRLTDCVEATAASHCDIWAEAWAHSYFTYPVPIFGVQPGRLPQEGMLPCVSVYLPTEALGAEILFQ